MRISSRQSYVCIAKKLYPFLRLSIIFSSCSIFMERTWHSYASKQLLQTENTVFAFHMGHDQSHDITPNQKICLYYNNVYWHNNIV